MKKSENIQSGGVEPVFSIINVLRALICSLPFLLLFSSIWFFGTWDSMTVNELVFNVKMSLSGASFSIIKLFMIEAALPTAICFVLLFLYFTYICREPGLKLKKIMAAAVSILALLAAVIIIWHNLELTEYIDQQLHASTFIEDNYVDPREVSVSFPEKKRNLIYIFLESMEVTDTDKAHGGSFDVSRIPELTDLALENENFRGSSESLSGGYSLPGTEWTMGAIFAQSTGLPLQISIDINDMSSQETFFPGVTGLGDILKDAGYHQEFLCGSDAVFGGRQLFFQSHGDYDIIDYPYAKQQGWIPQDYSVWWGFEDEKLIEFAKNRLLELSASDEPFNLTCLTVDTHFEDGYRCHLCEEEFADQYSNVYACSSRQVTEFISWIKQQDFYDNTTIVLCGDHPTMDADFCSMIEDGYKRRVYTCFINPAVETAQPDRTRVFSTFDLYPTTLAALGVNIEGNRLGLGTNLFSSEDTILEKDDFDLVEGELQRRSKFMNRMAGISDEEIANRNHQDPSAQVSLELTEDSVICRVSDFSNVVEQIEKLEFEYKPDGESEKKVIKQMELLEDGSYYISVPISEVNVEDTDYLVHLVSKLGNSWTIFSQNGDMRLKQTDLTEYLQKLNEYRNTGGYTIVVNTRKTAAAKLSQQQIQLLEDLGISEPITYGRDSTIIAVLGGGQDRSFVSYEKGQLAGEIEGVGNYDVRGSWNSASEEDYLLEINGINYMADRKGMHFAVINNSTGRVIDYVDFDLFDKVVKR